MTKVLRSLFAITVLTLAVALPAAADSANVKGVFTVTFALSPGTGDCAGNFAVEAHGIGQTAQGPRFFTIKKCFFVATARYVGSFALCPDDAQCGADSNDAVSGTYDGMADQYTGSSPQGIFTPFHGTLTVTRDNSRHGIAAGTIDFTAITGKPTGSLFGNAYYALH